MGKERLYRERARIDARNRVVIPSELLKEMKLKTNSQVNIFADFDDTKIIIRKLK